MSVVNGCGSVPGSLPANARGPDTIAIMAEEGKPAPEFTLTSDAGKSVALSDFRGKPVVLYFYPRNDTYGTIAQ